MTRLDVDLPLPSRGPERVNWAKKRTYSESAESAQSGHSTDRIQKAGHLRKGDRFCSAPFPFPVSLVRAAHGGKNDRLG